jgi:hypothetical protein
MRMRVSLPAAILLLTGCAGPISPPFGPGPEADFVLGILLLGGFLNRMAKRQDPKHPESPAFHILRERYARGELTRVQFQNMMRDLSSS